MLSVSNVRLAATGKTPGVSQRATSRFGDLYHRTDDGCRKKLGLRLSYFASLNVIITLAAGLLPALFITVVAPLISKKIRAAINARRINTVI